MVAGSFVNQTVSLVAPSRLWKGLIKDGHNLLPKVLPEQISSANLLEGNGGVGTVTEFHYTSARKYYSYVKERIDEVDEDKFVCKYTLVEGGLLGKKAKSVNFEVKFEPTPDGGTLGSFTTNYDTLSDAPLSQEDIDHAKAGSTAVFKALEAFLLANPTSYT